MVDERELTPEEHAVLAHVLDGGTFPCSEQLRAQLDGATVAGGMPTFLDLKTSDSSQRADCPNGPVPVRAIVETPDGAPEGEVLVWVTDGRLSGLEYAWYTDEAPTSLPAPERIRFVTS
jgi:hypothetical protein